MDSNLTSCNRCGHTSSQEAEVCAYCGADLPASGDTGSDKSDAALSNQADIAATELQTAAKVVEMSVTDATENAGPQEAADPIAAAPVNDIKMDVSETGIEITETQEISAADEGVTPGEGVRSEAPPGEDAQGSTTHEESIVDKLQSVSESAAEPVGMPAEPAADGAQDREKLVFDLPAETSVADIIPDANMETASAEPAQEPDSSALETSGRDTVEPEETLKAAEAPADVISLVRELAISSQPETLADASMDVSADASEDELEISIEPIEEKPKPEEQAKPAPQAESVKSEQLEEAIVLPLEAEVATVEIDAKDSAEGNKRASADSKELESVADSKETESLIIGDTVIEKAEPVSLTAQGQETDTIPEPSTLAPVELDSESQAAADEKKAVSKAQIIALKKRKLAKLAALKKKKIALAKAKALEKKKAALAKAQALKKKKEAQAASGSADQQTQLPEVTADVSAAAKQDAVSGIPALLEKYKGQSIGINYDNLVEIAEADLIEVNEAYFSVMVKDKKVRYSFPVKTILSIQESEEGVEIVESGKKTNYKAVVKVFPVVLF